MQMQGAGVVMQAPILRAREKAPRLMPQLPSQPLLRRARLQPQLQTLMGLQRTSMQQGRHSLSKKERVRKDRVREA